MAQFDFPATPTDGQVYTANGVTFVWSAADTAWKGQGSVSPLVNGQRVLVYDANHGDVDISVTWTKPANLKYLQVELWGGGGGGQMCALTSASQYSAGGGGGGGGYCKKLYVASDLNATEAILIGKGSVGTLTPSVPGTASTFKDMSAGGGAGGGSNGVMAAAVATAGPSIGLYSDGGAATGGDVNITGGGGDGGFVITIPKGGFGGASPCGGGTQTTRAPASTTSRIGLSGNIPGGGGTGPSNHVSQANQNGGHGAGGRCVLTEYYTENDTVGGGYLPLSGGTLTGDLTLPSITRAQPVAGQTLWDFWRNELAAVEYAWRFNGTDPKSMLLRRYDPLVPANYRNLISITPTSGQDADISLNNLTMQRGIIFPASQVVSADPNALDDSERGSFTPSVEGTTAAGSGTYTFRGGRYTKIGNKVFFELIASWTAHTGTGNIKISGLPFASIVGSWGPVVSIHADSLTFSGALSATIPNGQVYLNLATITTNAASGAVAMDTSATLNIAGHYTAA